MPDRRRQVKHSFLHLFGKAELALKDPEAIKLAILFDSPNGTVQEAKRRKMVNLRSIHALACIKRDHGEEFWKLQAVQEVFTGLDDLVRTQLTSQYNLNFNKTN